MSDIDSVTDIWYTDTVKLQISNADINRYQPMLIYSVMELACYG